MNLKRTIGAAAGTLLAFSAVAANYYVTPDGDDANDGQSWATAMRSPELLAEKYTTGAVVINVSNGVYRLTKPIVLAHTDGGSGVVSASGDASGVVFDCGGVTNCIYVKGYSNTFRGLTICNALYDSGSYGGAGLDAHRERMTVRDCVFSNCWCVAANKDLKGGAFYVGNGSSVSNVLVVDCGVLNTGTTKAADGGGCFLYGVDTKAIDLTVTNCAAIGPNAYGGGVYNWCASLTNCRIVGNVATNLSPTATKGNGGGIYCCAYDGNWTARQLKLSNVLVGANVSSGTGAGIFCYNKGTNFIDACSIVGNRCLNGVNGAGVHSVVPVFISRSCIADNVTTNVAGKGCGAGLYLGNGPHFVTDCVICDNTSGSTGCGIYTSDSAVQPVISNCVLRGNVALGNYGAFHFVNPKGALLTDCFVISNKAASGSIGGITGESANRAPVILRNSYFFGNAGEGNQYGNLRSQRGGSNSPVQIEYCTFVSNGIAGSSKYTLCPYSDSPNKISQTNDYIRNFFVTGCVLHGNQGTDIPKNLTIFPDHVTYTYADTLYAEYQASELHNLWKAVADPVFKDPDALDFSHGAGSPLIDAGEPVAPSWMGTGRKSGPQDMGDGHYTIGKVDDYGVTVIRSNAHQRLSNGIPDLGCFEYFLPPGLMLLFR